MVPENVKWPMWIQVTNEIEPHLTDKEQETYRHRKVFGNVYLVILDWHLMGMLITSMMKWFLLIRYFQYTHIFLTSIVM